MHGLILAAGEGSRLASAGMAIPKPIVEVAGKPQIVRLLETLDALGCASLTCAVRADVPAVRPLLDDALLRAPLTVIACRTPSSLHTLVEGLAVAPAGPVLCSMVDAVMRAEQWRRVYREVEAGLAAGADAVLVVTPYVDDESPVYVGRSADGAVSAVADSPIEPPCVTGGVYGLDPGARRAAAEAVAAGVQRMRGFLKAFVAAGRRVSARARAGRVRRDREPAAGSRLDRGGPRARVADCRSGGEAVTLFTHVLATTLGVQAMGLSGRDAALAYAFGVGVDVDHALKAPFYLRAVGLRDRRGYYWRSSLQEPVALLWIVPLCWFLGTVVPLVFFAVHVAMDYSVRFEKMPFYPYSTRVTRGWLTGIPDRVKEGVVFAVLLVLNVAIYWSRTHV
ncbi:MAG TPA: NTP transferase domain-containing protein [Gemmatimonadales bacterium]|nr:NTP transferase domain-containing protein [Gemmatimonadales bacterium]